MAAVAGANRQRGTRKYWLDPRFGIGLALVVVSVLGVYGIVTATDQTVRVYAAASVLTPGDRIDMSDLVVRNVRLGDSGNRYLGAGDVPPEGLVMTRTVAEGEFVPASAVGSVEGLRVASVVITLQGDLPSSVGPGAVVDIWWAKKAEQGVFDAPSVLVSSATVVRIVESTGLIAQRGTGEVEVVVPRDRIARVLEAVANSDAMAIVPVSQPIGR